MNNDKNSRYTCRFLGEGLAVSNDTRVTHLNNNDLIVGSSGASKTGSIVYAQLKSLRDSSLIVADTKGRLAQMLRRDLVERGYDVKILDFVNPEKSCIYNPLNLIRKNHDGSFREQDIAKLVEALVSENLDAKEAFWTMSARSVLEFFVAYTLAALPPEDHTMYTVCKLYRAFLQPMGEAAFRPWLDEHPDSLTAKRFAQIQGMRVADKTMSSIYAFVNIALKPFDYAELKYIFDPDFDKDTSKGRRRRSVLDIAGLGKKRTVLFLNISDNDHSLDALVNLFYTQALQTLISEADKRSDGQLQVPVRIIMDDFASSTIIPDFDKIISVVRSRDIWLTLCIQSFTQLESIYSQAQALTVVNNCDHIIYMGSNDMSSAQFIGTRACKTPETILCMDRSKEYVLEAGKPVCLINKIPPYRFEMKEDVAQIS